MLTENASAKERCMKEARGKLRGLGHTEIVPASEKKANKHSEIIRTPQRTKTFRSREISAANLSPCDVMI